MWRPFEEMDWETQEPMLPAAATALALTADGQISARGVLGSALRPIPYRAAYEGERPPPDLPSLMEATLIDARHFRNAARQLLVMLTFSCRALARFEEQRT